MAAEVEADLHRGLLAKPQAPLAAEQRHRLLRHHRRKGRPHNRPLREVPSLVNPLLSPRRQYARARDRE